MKKTDMLLFILLLAANLAIYAQEKPQAASYLIEGVEKIYVVDESRCSSPKNPDEAGKVYLIEGKEKIEKIRKELQLWTDMSKEGACGCGGPDKHYYCVKRDGSQEYWGLDCDTFLNNKTIPEALNELINPNSKWFVGSHCGHAYLAEAPLTHSEKELGGQLAQKGYLLCYNEWYKDCILKAKAENDGINIIETILEIKTRKQAQNNIEEKKEDVLYGEIGLILDAWFHDLNAKNSIELTGDIYSDHRKPSTSPIEKTIFLSSVPDNLKIGHEYGIGSTLVTVKKMTQVAHSELDSKYFYEVTIVGKTANDPEETKKIKTFFPFLKNIRCICERFPSANGWDHHIYNDPEIARTAKLLHSAMPLYPAEADAIKLSGRVAVELIVSNDGSVENARILSSSNSVFNENTLAAVKTWKFTPPTDKKGNKVKAYIIKIIKFVWTEPKNDKAL